MYAMSTGPRDAHTVLLLHGGGVAGWMWAPLRDRLAADHRVIVPDLPGHGRSSREPYVSHADTVSRLVTLLEQESPDSPVSVIGFSLGAQLALELAATHPSLIRDAVIVSAQVERMPLTGLTLALLALSAPLARRRWFAKLQARELFIPPAMMDDYIRTSRTMSRTNLLAAVGGNLQFTLPDSWSHFEGRSLVLVGSKERRIMRGSAETIHAAQPASALEVVDGCGHGIPLQRPDWFADRVRVWLAAAN
jgi:pimeloyl-ACP methyl ester carboxylesterase